MIEIKPHKIVSCRVAVPGSKSYTHRMLVAAALSDGMCVIKNALLSEDTRYTMQALQQMGVQIETDGDRLRVYGRGGRLAACHKPLYLGNSGSSLRLLTATAVLGTGTYILTGTARMHKRPIEDLIKALRQLGIKARSLKNNGCPPVQVAAATIDQDGVNINCRKSSQYLSALLLMAPCTPKGLVISVTGGPVSRPYVDLTTDVMRMFDIDVAREGYRNFSVAGGQVYRAGTYTVEADCSQAAYFWGAAAISGAAVKVMGINPVSVQGDIRLLELLQQMGCRVFKEPDGIRVVGGSLGAIEADLADLPDQVPTLAVVAAFAKGTTVIKNVAHLKAKESNRLSATVTELNKMGVEAACTDRILVVKGGKPKDCVVETYNDHRIAMSFAMAGLKVAGLRIENQDCVEKSFPGFWRIFEKLYQP